MNAPEVKQLIHRVAGYDQKGGNQRLKQIIERVVTDMCRTIEDFDITPSEFWTACGYITRLGQANEVGLLVPGLGLEHFLDLLWTRRSAAPGSRAARRARSRVPLYITDAPLSKGEARLDQDPEHGLVLFMDGQVKDTDGNPVAGRHRRCLARQHQGRLLAFRPVAERRTICAAGSRPTARGVTGSARSCPSGYGCAPDSPTQELLSALGRHGHRPAHIHFFVEAPGFRKLTTQINFAGDEYLHDDFAFATRDGLIPEAGPPR